MKLIAVLLTALFLIAIKIVVIWWALSVLLPVFGLQPFTPIQAGALWALLTTTKLIFEKRS